jgi:hypothetical protein
VSLHCASARRQVPTFLSRVNAVETLYAAFPAFMYIDPNLGGLLLEPLFQLQASSSYRVPYAAADLGSSRNQRLEALIIEGLKGQITLM